MAEITRAEIDRILTEHDRRVAETREALAAVHAQIQNLAERAAEDKQDWRLTVNTVERLGDAVDTLDMLVVRGNGRESLKTITSSLTRSVEANRLHVERLDQKISKHFNDKEIANIKGRWALGTSIATSIIAAAVAIAKMAGF